MTAVKVALPRLNTYDGPREFQTFLATLAPHWGGLADVVLDFKRCRFLSAEGAALLATFKAGREVDRFSTTEIEWGTVATGVMRQMARWGLTALFGRPKDDRPETAIPLLHQAELDSRALTRYVCSVVGDGDTMPVMSSCLAKEVERSVCELFQNVFAHASSPCGGIALGQLYPKS